MAWALVIMWHHDGGSRLVGQHQPRPCQAGPAEIAEFYADTGTSKTDSTGSATSRNAKITPAYGTGITPQRWLPSAPSRSMPTGTPNAYARRAMTTQNPPRNQHRPN